MEIWWNGVDIAPHVTVKSCVHLEDSRGGCDQLDMVMDHAATWYRWGPATDDEIRITAGGYDTGTLYLQAVVPDGDAFRVIAGSTKSAARRKIWKSYEGVTLAGLVHNLAVECGMQSELYGTKGLYTYAYVAREDETVPAFLDRIAAREGIALKAVGGAFRGIDILWAQDRAPVMRLNVTPGQAGARWTRNDGVLWSRLQVISPWASGSASDADAAGRPERALAVPDVADSIIAGRWARGLLLSQNRQAERLKIEMDLNPALVAMERIDVEGNDAIAGEWIVDDAMHDLKNMRSEARLVRVLRGIK